MPKDDSVYIGHMIDTANKALGLVKGKTKDDFYSDEVLSLALTHLCQVIGEAAGRVSDEFCENNQHIPWEAITGMRHKVVHDYLDVDLDIVWDTIAEELGPLVQELEKILEE